MTKPNKPNQLLESCEETFKLVLDTLKKKNSDYAGDSKVGPYKNFQDFELTEFIEKSLKSGWELDAVELGIRVRMKDKWSRINTLLLGGLAPSVTSESFDDTLIDVIGYAAIWRAWRQFKQFKTFESIVKDARKPKKTKVGKSKPNL